MTAPQSNPPGPDLAVGISVEDLADGSMLTGHVGEEAVLLARRGDEYFAIGANCSHYGGPLAEGLMVEDTVRCPWHHACFSLRTGEALRAPALSPVTCWSAENRGGRILVQHKKGAPESKSRKSQAGKEPQNIVIVGGGAAGFAAAEKLRREQYHGSIIMLSNDDAPPVDRPNLSKDYLAGKAPEEWVPLRPSGFYPENAIDLRLKTNVTAIDAQAREVGLTDGKKITYDRLLLATGAEPVRLSIPGADRTMSCAALPLRLPGDHRSCEDGPRAVVLGASFIGLEVAASLRARNLEVHVVAPEKRPMERSSGHRWATSCARSTWRRA